MRIRAVFHCVSALFHLCTCMYTVLPILQVQDNSSITVTVRLEASAPVPIVLKSNLLDPNFDYDFTDEIDDGTQYMRGGKLYKRPYGWMRIALNVIGKYDDDDWLGPMGVRKESSNMEWPVSYHGTNEDGRTSIAEEGYLLSKCKRFLYGIGIYSTPSIAVAEQYAEVFKHKEGLYAGVMQNRVKNEKLTVISAKECGDEDEYWVQENEKFIRPYGLCLKKLC